MLLHRSVAVFAVLPLLLLGQAVLPNSASAQQTKDTLETVKKNLNEKKAVLVDVREKDEWDEGHIQGAIRVSLSDLEQGAKDEAFLAALAKKLSKEKIVYCHCRTGRRALAAGKILSKVGYDTRPLKAGYDGLIEAGFEKAKEKKP
jgi:rhodanese-related sulfurtransferase